MNRPARNRRVSSLPGAASNPLTPPGTARHAFRISIALHLGLVLALLLGSLCAKGCASTKKEPEELIFVDFDTVERNTIEIATAQFFRENLAQIAKVISIIIAIVSGI